jgi:hypothetical protein
MVSKLQLFSIYSFLYVRLDPHKKFHVGEELTFYFIFVWMQDDVIYVKPMYFNISGIKNQFFEW